MPSRTTILVAIAISSLAFGATAALARSGYSGGTSIGGSKSMSTGMSKGSTGMGTGMSGVSTGMGASMSKGMVGAHMGGMHHHHHQHFFFGGVGYAPDYADYDDSYDDSYDDGNCPLVRRRVRTNHGLRWRTVRACAY
jgi:hypothetical protein